MTDFEYIRWLCYKNDKYYNHTVLWDENNKRCGDAIWFEIGHIEFDLDGKLTNVVTY